MIGMTKTDMVRAYAESLIEQVTGADKAKADNDGDYPVRYRSALYYVRIDPGPRDDPVVQVFAVAVDKIESGPPLYEALNDINARLRFARTFWVKGAVLIEADMPGLSLSLDGFGSACDAVAYAADHFGPLLAEQFGGKTVFEDEKGADYERSGLGSWGYL
jgi:hypothetical protein